jgi:hypothetical protein
VQVNPCSRRACRGYCRSLRQQKRSALCISYRKHNLAENRRFWQDLPMTHQYMVAGLAKKRGELAGEIRATSDHLAKLVKDLEAVDAALGVVAPDMEVESIRPRMFRPPSDWANRGQMSRMVLLILRQAREPLTTKEIAAQMLLERALDVSDVKLLTLMVRRVGSALRHQRDKGNAVSVDQIGNYQLWQISR